jgi:CreA protein
MSKNMNATIKKLVQNLGTSLLFLAAASPALAGSDAREIGAVSTEIKLLGPNHKIVVSAFNDPKVDGITCYIARPKVGGFKGGIGIAEDPSIASVSCAQTGAVTYKGKIETSEKGEEVFDEKRSIIFKTLKVNRLYDKDTGALVYVVRTTKFINGSPMTALSVVMPTAWGGTEPQKPELK